MKNPETENPPIIFGLAKVSWPRVLILSALAFCLASSSIHADTADETGEIAPRTPEVDDAKEREGWQFEVGAGFLLHSQAQSADVSVDWAPGQPDLSLSNGRVEPALAPGFTLEATVLTPALTSHEYAPRLFVQAGYENLLEDSFATYRGFDSSALSGSGICNIPSEITVQVGGNPEAAIPVPGLDSCDSTTSIDTAIQDMWFLGVGVQVPLPIFEDRMKLRLGLNYLGQRWGDAKFSWSRSQTWGVCTSRNYPTAFLPNALGVPYIGTNGQCVLLTDPAPVGPDVNWERGNRTQVASKDEVSSTFAGATTHALGINLSALVDVYQVGDFQLRFFLNTRFAWILNDSEAADVITSEYGTFNVSTSPDSFIAQAGGGVRIYWTPRW